MMYCDEQIFGNFFIDDEAEEMSIPVPVELENGTYKVKAHQLNNIWKYEDGDCAELVFEFDLDVTDEDTNLTYTVKKNPIKALDDTSYTKLESNYERPEFSFKEALPGGAKLDGFAISEDGVIFALSGCDSENGNTIRCSDSINALSAGKYDCYF